MPQLLYSPRLLVLDTDGTTPVPGAKVYFYVTGTTTPKDAYSDVGLTTPVTNPLIADSSGYCDPVYLANDTRYRIKVTTSADVLIDQQDDVGPDTVESLGAAGVATANTFTTMPQKLSAAEIRWLLDETDAGSNKRLWEVNVNAGVLTLRTRTDADGAGKGVVTVTRGTGTAITALEYGNSTDLPTHTFQGAQTVNGASTVVGGAKTTRVAVTFSATAMVVDCSLSNYFSTTLTANVTTAPTFTNKSSGQTINWRLTQDGTGGRTMTWPSTSIIKWVGGSAPTLSTTAGKHDMIVLSWDDDLGLWLGSALIGF